VVKDTALQVEFLRQAFQATGELRTDRPSIIHIGDSRLLISSAGVRDVTAAFLYLYVEDADATYAGAIDAGAASLEEPTDVPYGDRRAMIKDPCGNVWQIATYSESAE
jgi:PhnB protein